MLHANVPGPYLAKVEMVFHPPEQSMIRRSLERPLERASAVRGAGTGISPAQPRSR